MSLLPAFRPYEASTDAPFVFRSWISSFERSPWAGVIPSHVFYDLTKIAINQLIARGTQIILAVNPDDDQQILGFVAFEKDLLHYCFVKDVFRRSGIATQLMAFANLDRSHLLHTFRTHDAKYLGKLVHRPGLARRKAGYP